MLRSLAATCMTISAISLFKARSLGTSGYGVRADKVMACRVAPQERKVLVGKVVVAHCVAQVIVEVHVSKASIGHDSPERGGRGGASGYALGAYRIASGRGSCSSP